LIDQNQLRMLIELAMAVAVWPMLMGIFLIVGSRQSREGQGTAGRLWLVSMTAATLATLPLIIWVVSLLPPYPAETSFGFALGLTVLSAVGVGRYLAQPVRIGGSTVSLPLVDDEQFLARVPEISTEMGIETPRVRLLRSSTGSLDTMAYVGGLPAPMVVMTDGAMHRLEETERDAILAHELSHIATGSLWWYPSLVPMAAVAAILASSYLPLPVAAAVGLAFFVGMKRIVSRRFEFQCDRCAGDVLGHREMATALVKIHAAHIVPNKGVMSFLTYATATHPPLVSRVAALRSAAPVEDRSAIKVDSSAVARHRMGAWLALLLWAAAIAAAFWIGRDPVDHFNALLLLTGVVAFPSLVLSASINKKVNVALRRMGTSGGLSKLAFICVLLLALAYSLYRTASWEAMAAFAVLGSLFTMLVLMVSRWKQRLHTDVITAIREHDYRRAVEMAAAHPDRVRENPKLRHNVAMARALSGDRRRAIAELRQLIHDVPSFQLGALTLAITLLDEDAEEAASVAADAASKLKNDPGPLAIQARALRKLGRTAAADDAIQRALKIAPEDGCVLALAAGVAVDRGENEQAAELLERALNFAPGDAFCLVVAAELTLATGTPEAAIAAVERATGAAGHNPFAFLGGEIARLRAHPAVAERFAAAEELVWDEDAAEE